MGLGLCPLPAPLFPPALPRLPCLPWPAPKGRQLSMEVLCSRALFHNPTVCRYVIQLDLPGLANSNSVVRCPILRSIPIKSLQGLTRFNLCLSLSFLVFVFSDLPWSHNDLCALGVCCFELSFLSNGCGRIVRLDPGTLSSDLRWLVEQLAQYTVYTVLAPTIGNCNDLVPLNCYCFACSFFSRRMCIVLVALRPLTEKRKSCKCKYVRHSSAIHVLEDLKVTELSSDTHGAYTEV